MIAHVINEMKFEAHSALSTHLTDISSLSTPEWKPKIADLTMYLIICFKQLISLAFHTW